MQSNHRNRARLARRPRRSRSEPDLERVVAWLRARLEPFLRTEGQPLGPGGFPVRHLVVLGVLVAVLLLVFLVGRMSGDDADVPRTPVQRVETISVPPMPGEVEGAPSAGGASRADPAQGDQGPTRQVQVPVPAARAPEPDALPEPQPIISRPGTGSAAVEPGTAAARTPAPAAAPAAAPASGPASAPVSAPAPVPAPTAPPAGSARAPAAIRTADWIMAQPPGHFTLQLVSLSSAERAQAYIAAQPDPGAFATYRLMRNGQLFHVVVHGAYATRAEAEQAAARLPGTVGNVQPWIRQFAQVQESVRTALQQ